MHKYFREKMKNSDKSFDVFDFKEEDELQNPDPAHKYNPKFAEKGGSGTEKMSCSKGDLLFHFSRDEHQRFVPSKLSPNSTCGQLDPRVLVTEATALVDKISNDALPESKSSDEADDVFVDADESPSESSPSTSSFIPGDDDDVPSVGDESLPDACFDIVQELGDRNVTLVCPDHIVYQGRHSTKSVLIFSNESLRLTDSATHGDQEISKFEWGVEDIVDIQSQWSKRLETAMVKIHVLPKVAEDSLVEELQFAVADVNWPEKQEIIMSLHVRYKAVWNVVVNTELEMDAQLLSGTNGENIWRKSYFPEFVEFSDEVVYPKGDPDAVSISKRDVDLLQPDVFVNDTIIDFYIKYLKNQMPLEKRSRFHFFNSFFFRKLIDLDKDPPSSFEGKAAFQRVRKWTRKVNLFEKDYVFIPVNYSYHWSLIVICHPGEVTKLEDTYVKNPCKVPCILHMDSMKGSHTVLKDVVQSYLCEEWKEKNKDTPDDISPKFLSMRFVSLELPQQPNAYDCGLFLLHYVERFLEESPINFSPWKITHNSRFLNVDWFQPGEPCLKRAHIQRLICKILEEENSAARDSDDPANNNALESNAEFVSKRSGPSKSVGGNLSGSQAGDGIQITLLQMSSSQCGGDSNLVLREFMEAGNTGPLLDGRHQTFDQAAAFGAMGHMQNDVEACGQVADAMSNINPDSVFYLSNDFREDFHDAELNDFDEYPEKSIAGSSYSSEVEIQEHNSFGETHIIEGKTNEPRSLSAEKLLSAPNQTLDVADFGSRDHIRDAQGCSENDRYTFELLDFTSQQGCNGENNGDVASADIDVVQVTSGFENEEQQDSETVPETSEMPDLEMIGKNSIRDDLVLESDGLLVGKRSDEVLLPELEELPPAKRLPIDSSSKIEKEEPHDSETVSETRGMLDSEVIGKDSSIRDDLLSESDGLVVAKSTGEVPLPELYKQQPLKRLRLDSSPEVERDEQHDSETFGIVDLETIGKVSNGDDLVSESDGRLVAERTGEIPLPEWYEQQPAKRPRLDSCLEVKKEGKQYSETVSETSALLDLKTIGKDLIGDDLVSESAGLLAAKSTGEVPLPELDP